MDENWAPNIERLITISTADEDVYKQVFGLVFEMKLQMTCLHHVTIFYSGKCLDECTLSHLRYFSVLYIHSFQLSFYLSFQLSFQPQKLSSISDLPWHSAATCSATLIEGRRQFGFTEITLVNKSGMFDFNRSYYDALDNTIFDLNIYCMRKRM